MKAEVAIIGGTGFDLGGIVDEVVTPYGTLKVRFTRLNGSRVDFISRHGQE
jgi:purine nucleoside phosphorylase